MTGMYGAIRSNHFRVKNVESFTIWFSGYYFGEDIRVFNDGDDIIAFGAYQQYPTAYPHVSDLTVGNEETGEMVDNPEPEFMDADLDQFAREIREHLLTGEIFYVVAGGHEGLRYVGFSELAIAEDDEQVYYAHSFSDDVDGARKKIETLGKIPGG